jgi:hypothetical protein
MTRPNSYRLTNSPMTRSCICSVFEKQIVRRTSRLSGITNPAGIHGHIHNLRFDVWRLTGIGILQQKGASLACGLSAATALLTLRCFPVAYDIGAVAVWAMQDLSNHTTSPSWRSSYSSP